VFKTLSVRRNHTVPLCDSDDRKKTFWPKFLRICRNKIVLPRFDYRLVVHTVHHRYVFDYESFDGLWYVIADVICRQWSAVMATGYHSYI